MESFWKYASNVYVDGGDKKMKLIFLIIFFLAGLSGCSHEPLEVVGKYKFDSKERLMVLSIGSDQSYSIEIKDSNLEPRWIRGRWQSENVDDNTISFAGVIWKGTVPRTGNGFWIAKVDGHPPQICLDGEELECFHKN